MPSVPGRASRLVRCLERHHGVGEARRARCREVVGCRLYLWPRVLVTDSLSLSNATTDLEPYRLDGHGRVENSSGSGRVHLSLEAGEWAAYTVSTEEVSYRMYLEVWRISELAQDHLVVVEEPGLEISIFRLGLSSASEDPVFVLGMHV